jgi:hypothetical protein
MLNSIGRKGNNQGRKVNQMPYKERDRHLAHSKEYNKVWYQQHRQEVMERSKIKKGEIKAWYKEYKKQLQCIVCGEDHPACLQFHHRNKEEKSFTIGDLARRPTSKKRLLDEIAKCDVLCVNCHAKLHWEEKHEADDLEEIVSLGQ